LAVLAFPGAVMGLLLATTLEGLSLVIARMLGLAIMALGVTWWLAGSDLQQQLRRIAPGFIIYNVGMGVLFLCYALSSARAVPWAVALVHLLVGFAFTAGVVINVGFSRSDERGSSIPAA
jgi:hypothetical protein